MRFSKIRLMGLKVLIMCTLLIASTSTAAFANVGQREHRTPRTGVFIWNSHNLNDTSIDFMKTHEVNEVYLYIDPSVNRMTYIRHVYALKDSGFSVYALSGAPEWVLDMDYFNAFFEWMHAYEKISQQATSFDGIVFDIEPYILERTRQETIKDYTAYQDILAKAKFISDSNGWDLRIVIPFWFDSIEYNNAYGEGYLAEWIFDDFCNPIIMAYRNTIHGDNGVIQLIQEEISHAHDNANMLTIALETAPSLEGDYLSFSGTSQEELDQAIQGLDDYFNSAGLSVNFAVHYLHSWMALEEAK